MCSDAKITDEQKLRISGLWDTLKRYDTYIGTVNFKSGLLASFNTAVFGGILLKADQILNQHIKYPLLTTTTLGSISILSIISLLWVVCSVWPNLKSSSLIPATQNRSLFFFGSVSKYYTPNTYAETLKSSSTDEIEHDLATQAHEVAVILSLKFGYIARASFCTSLNLIALLTLAGSLLIPGGEA